MKISDGHLSPEQLIDVAEAPGAEAWMPHLSSCDRCRREVEELRAAMGAVTEVDVPEPPPLFWKQFSGRVQEAVADEAVTNRTWRFDWTWPRAVVPVSAAAIIAILVVLQGSRGSISNPPATNSSPAVVSTAVDDSSGNTLDVDNDLVLAFVFDLTADMDVNAAAAAGLTSRGSAEHAVTHMDAKELRELQRLLKDELAHSGA